MCLRMRILKYTMDCYKRLLKYPINLIVLLLPENVIILKSDVK